MLKLIDTYLFICAIVITMLRIFNSLLIIQGSIMNKIIIQVKAKNVYGKELLYPICDVSKLLCELLNVKTFSDHNIRKLTALNYHFALNNEDYQFENEMNKRNA